MNQYEARIRVMIEQPGLYSMNKDDTEALKWSLARIESLALELNQLRLYASEQARRLASVRELAEKIAALVEAF